MKPASQSSFDQLPTENYDALLKEKSDQLSKLLQPFTDADVLKNMAIYASPAQHFRMRAEFGIWHDGDECYYTMVKKEDGQSQRVQVTRFPIASEAINRLMPTLLEKIHTHPMLKQKLFQVEFLSTLTGDMLVTLIYHKRLDDEWLALAKQLEIDLNCHVLGRSRKQKLIVSQDFVVETLTINDTVYTYQQVEGSFTQPNADICQKMLTWACEQASNHQSPDRDLLELYCGNGNFTLPLSRYFRNVLATEISKTSVYSAEWNIEKNGIDNIGIARLSAEEFTEAKQGKRAFRRLKQANITLADYDFSTIFVDPPRAGIDEDTLSLLTEFDMIIYISCNPLTLADNLKALTETHTIVSTALFDQFPYTDHIESGVFLQKKVSV